MMQFQVQPFAIETSGRPQVTLSPFVEYFQGEVSSSDWVAWEDPHPYPSWPSMDSALELLPDHTLLVHLLPYLEFWGLNNVEPSKCDCLVYYSSTVDSIEVGRYFPVSSAYTVAGSLLLGSCHWRIRVWPGI